MKRSIFAVLAVALLSASACTTSPPAAPQSPQQAVYAAKASYAVALSAAVAYKKLPTCTAGGAPLCSDPKVVATLQKVDTASIALLDAAEATVRTPGAGANAQTAVTAATQAVAAFTTITQALAPPK